MKITPSNQSGIFVLRLVLACALVALAAVFAFRAFAANPANGTITPFSPPVTWTGTGTGVPPAAGGESDCEEGANCDTFVLNISGTPSEWVGKQVKVRIQWLANASDYDLYVHKGSLDGPVIASSGAGGTTFEELTLNPNSSNIGTGTFHVRTVYFAATPADQYSGAASVIAAGLPPIAAPLASGVAPRYQNYTPPAAGPATLGLDAGEPSIGVNWNSEVGLNGGRSMYIAILQTLRITFTDTACPSSPSALWENKSAPNTNAQSFDPILFTDNTRANPTGRTQISQLLLAGSASSFTDDDGEVWVASQGAGITSGIDHQTVGGGGPFHAPLIPLPGKYPNAIYYCAQALVDGNCAISLDGGATYGPAVVAWTDQCGGLHGHLKVGPDGTAYLPNKDCGGNQGLVVSENNGLNWLIRPVPGSTTAGSDAAVGIGRADKISGKGRIYLGYADGDTRPVISTSTDAGLTWTQPLDVGAVFGINNVVFPAVVAGDDDRAAFAFYGTPTEGGLTGPKFAGIWHLYVAHTYDGGQSWRTVDVTPNDPMQRGCIWLGGGANICRNMLDFMGIDVDKRGRVLIAYNDGCAGAECSQAAPTATGDSYTSIAALARQTGGKGLFAAHDALFPDAPTVPGAPYVTALRNGGTVRLAWSTSNNGGSPVTGYTISRGTTSGGESLLATVPGSQLRYVDTTATDPAATYFYKVEATNAQGTSCGNNEVSARYLGDSRAGVGFTLYTDPTGATDGGPQAANPDLDIQTLSIAEPGTGPHAGKLVFNLKVVNLAAAPNERMWRVIWDSPNAPAGKFYVGMTKDSNGAVTFEYGTVFVDDTGVVVGIPMTTKVGDPDAASFTPEGLITIVLSKSKVASPNTGDLLGNFEVRTYNVVSNIIRTTNAIDSATNATANDLTANAATYALVGPASAQLQNIATRAQVGTAEKVLIGGFIITGTDPKRVVLRGRGPSLTGFPGITDPLHDPIMELYNSTPGTPPIAMNDDWQQTQKAEIEAIGFAPTSPLESVIVQRLAPGAYTVIVRDKDLSAPRIGLVEVFDISPTSNSQLGNLSSRGFVGIGDNLLIGGVIVGPVGTGNANVLVRSLGPSLTGFGVPGALDDPRLTVVNQSGTTLASNDDWRANEAAITAQAPNLAPSRNEEAALIISLAPGQYTAIVDSKSGTGVATVEVYGLTGP